MRWSCLGLEILDRFSVKTFTVTSCKTEAGSASVTDSFKKAHTEQNGGQGYVSHAVSLEHFVTVGRTCYCKNRSQKIAQFEFYTKRSASKEGDVNNLDKHFTGQIVEFVQVHRCGTTLCTPSLSCSRKNKIKVNT